MNLQGNLVPHKHVRFSESVLALAGWLRGHLTQPRTVDELWAILDRDESGWPSRPTFTTLILAINTLYAIGQLKQVGSDGRVRLENS